MDSLANYGSDDEYEDNSGDNMATSSSKNDGGQYYSPEEADANYDEVQMDMSEESNNNNSNEEEDNRRRDYSPRDRDRSRSPNHDSNSRSYDKRSNTNDSRSFDQRASNSRQNDNRPRKQDYRTKYEEDKRYDEDRDRSSRRYSEDDRDKRKYDDDRPDRRRYDRKEDNDSKRSPDYREDRRDKKKYRRSSSKERRRSSSRERRRSTSRDRRRSTSRDRKRSSSRERRRSRSPRKSRRSRSKERDSGRYPKKFDRTTNKMAQLEKLGIEIKTPDAEFITPQMLLQRSMDEQVQKVKNSTGIELPKYYNPAAMNPARYADQIQKRRLLWQKNTTPGSTSTPTVSQAPVEPTKEVNNPANRPNMGKIWENTTFAQDSDGKVASKFKRLMGIKEPGPEAANSKSEILKKQEEMFSSMEQQYEVARTATHTMRGVGLGFGSYQYPR